MAYLSDKFIYGTASICIGRLQLHFEKCRTRAWFYWRPRISFKRNPYYNTLEIFWFGSFLWINLYHKHEPEFKLLCSDPNAFKAICVGPVPSTFKDQNKDNETR